MQWQQIDVQESVHIYRLLMFFARYNLLVLFF